MRTRWASVFSMILAGSLCAQLKVDVRQVVVPAIVNDKKGRFAGGLSKNDFTITEDGVPQEIVAFSKETASSILDSAGEKHTGPAPGGSQGRLWVICFDSLHTSAASAARTKTTLEKLFSKAHSNGDQFVLLNLGDRIRMI
jgi:VWFA-related protein